MRKIIYQVWISLDGYAADGDNSTKFFEDPAYSVDSDNDLLAEMDNIGTIILGANTYKMFAQYWPKQTQKEELMAAKINSTPKIVFSKTIREAPWGDHRPVEIINQDAIATLEKLKKQAGKDIVLWGSISLAQALMNKKLIDEWHIRIVPVTLGAGLPLFNHNIADLAIIEAKPYASGLVLLKYRLR